ncbi:MAG: hypothetical protein ABFS56_07430 [Pseudomonadota bacterium]
MALNLMRLVPRHEQNVSELFWDALRLQNGNAQHHELGGTVQ